MKNLFFLLIITVSIGQEQMHGPFELFIGTRNHLNQSHTFLIEKAGTTWNNLAHNYQITNEIIPNQLTISGNTAFNNFQYGWDWINSGQGGIPPYYGGKFTYGFYKFSTLDAYFYLDYRDCRFQSSSVLPYDFVIDIFIIYNGNTHSFSFIPSSTGRTKQTIQNGSIINIWDAFDTILEVGPDSQFCFEEYIPNSLALYAPQTKAKLFWAPPPPEEMLPTKYRIWYAWALNALEPIAQDYYWIADINAAYLDFTDLSNIDKNTTYDALHSSYYYIQALNGTQSLYTANIVNNLCVTDWTKALKITNDNNRPRITWAPFDVNNELYGYDIYRKVETIPPSRPPAQYQFLTNISYGSKTLCYTDNYFQIGGNSLVASYYVVPKQPDYSGPISNIVSSNVLLYKNKSEVIINEFGLNQNYPNPFNPRTKISYSIKEEGFVTLKVFDILGKEIETLVNENKPSGNNEVEFNASLLPSGMYIYKLQAGSFVNAKKMILTK